ncbi:MAG: SDR family NAD(P)-dependent oxidoreductase, partial [Rhodobiaceae bacterium]|nr:SDR family NAD(P)-dependent oxidoreductase [Rhodobiaceae bacterium]
MINNKTVLITGAAKRIGKSIASDLAKNSWNIVIHYNNSDKEANELAEQIIK